MIILQIMVKEKIMKIFSNLPWQNKPLINRAAIAGSKDNFLLNNDLVFLPVKVNNILGFSVWVGGILSSVLNDYAIPLNVWIEDNKICEFTNAVLSLFLDYEKCLSNGLRRPNERKI